jgi:hypothetical protein
MSLKNKALREIKLSKLTNIVYVKKKLSNFTTFVLAMLTPKFGQYIPTNLDRNKTLN